MINDLKTCPYIIAKKLHEYQSVRSYAEKYDLLEKIYAQVLRYFSCICLSEYLLDSGVHAKINLAINSLIRPSLGDWLNFLHVYITTKLRAGEALFMQELPALYGKLAQTKVDVLVDEGDLDHYEKRSVLEAILLFRNKLRHGASTPDESMFKAYVDIYEPCIVEILKGLEEVFSKYRVMNYQGREGLFGPLKFKELTGYRQDAFKTIEIDDSAIEMDIELHVDELYLYDANKRIIPLSGLFKTELEEDEEEYIVYDGLNRTTIKYVGVKRSYVIEHYIDQLRAKFTNKKISLKFGGSRLNVGGMKEYINDLSLVSIGIHERSGKYSHDHYVKREADRQVDNFIASDKTGLLITAEAGSGKTNLVCSQAKELIEAGHMVYFINGYKLMAHGSHAPVFSELREELLCADTFFSLGDFFSLLHKQIEENDRFILIVDAVNESFSAVEVMAELDRIIAMLPFYVWLKVIVTLRTEFYQRLKHYITEKMGKKFHLFGDTTRYYTITREQEVSKELELKNWNLIQQKEAYDKYASKYAANSGGFFALPPALWKLLALPLHMKLYFAILEQEGIKADQIINKKDLFAAYHQYRLVEAGDMSQATYELLLYIVEEIVARKKNTLEAEIIDQYNDLLLQREKIKDAPGVLTPYERLLDLGIVQERLVKQWYETRFVYQAYLEYLIFLLMQEKKLEDEDLVALYLQSIHWTELPEMHGALQLMLISKKEGPVGFATALLTQAQADNLDMEMIKEGVIDAFGDIILATRGTAKQEQVIAETADCLQHFALNHWLLELGRRLYQKNALVEANAILSVVEKEAHLLEDRADKFKLYNLLGLINQEQCASTELVVAYFEKAGRYGTEQQMLITRAYVAKTYRLNGMLEQAEALLDEMMAQKGLLEKDLIAAITVYYQRQLCYRARSQFDRSLALGRLNYDRRKEVESETVKLNLKAEYATELEYSQFYHEAIDLTLEVLNEAAELEDMNLFVDTMNGLSRRYERIGEFEKSIYWAKEGLVLWEHAKNYRGQLVMYVHILNSYHGLGASHDKVELYLKKAAYLAAIVKEGLILKMYKDALELWL